MYAHGTGKARIVLIVYVNDLLTVVHKDYLKAFKTEFKSQWEVRDYREPNVFLGADIERNREEGTIKLSQHTYIESNAKHAGVTNTTPISTPFEPNQVLTAHDNDAKNRADQCIYRSIVGMLMFCVTISRCECAYQVKELSRHLNNPMSLEGPSTHVSH